MLKNPRKYRPMFEEAVDLQIAELKHEIAFIELLREEISGKFFRIAYPLGPISDRTLPSIPNEIGVYMTQHIPSRKICYIGQGNLLQRRGRQRQVFMNKGQPKLYSSGKNGIITSSNDHPGARKMFAYDPDINNWQIWMRALYSKSLAQKMEIVLQERVPTMFNDEKMNGV